MVRVRDFQHSFLLYCNAQKVNSLNTETTVEFGSNDGNTIDNPPIIDLDEFDSILEKTTSKINDNEYDPLNNREVKTKTNKETVNIDVISINSNDEVAGFESNNVNCIDVNDDSSDNCSYHSSDFEFITEEEANIDGFIINFRAKTVNKKQAEFDKLKNASGINFHRHYLPGTSRVEYADEFSYRENHIIPEGDEYLSLFQGIYAPVFAPLHFMENKSVRSNCMNVEFEGIGFDMKLLNKKNMEDTTEEAYKEEAEESARKILEMYPADNRKRRRRF
ncbi:uncharacterized protein LOC131852218 [Achroia grisella]|uniref:uncharacterized protein LOC131852218 n=1 Tax=Achroia grisella TaxID=688607 RepID=UPI0027D327FB|nr:uncharacterized protein LOC131852218 [Achroia grisella]